MRTPFLKLIALAGLLLCGVASIRAQVNGNATISANDPAFGPISISTSSQYAGAISSLKWGGKEFINNWDHGRQLQPNYEFFNRYECYNVYEAGSKDDVNLPTTSSQLLSLTASGNALESTTQMAWYMPRREPRQPESVYGDYCGDPNYWIRPVPDYTGQPSAYRVHKTVTIGFAGIPNVIDYQSDLLIPEPVLKGLNQITAVLPYEFSTMRSYDVVSKQYRRIRQLGGGDENVKVMATADGRYALGFYSPDILQFPGDDTSNWWYTVPPTPGSTDLEFPCVHVGSITRYESAQAGDHSYDRAYLVIGNLDQVKESLGKVHLQFRALDPEVFNWRDYVAINHFEAALPTRAAAESHWLNYGIAEGRTASRTFSPSQYLQLNPDVAGANNAQAAIDHYISSGRSEGRGTVAKAAAGMQHVVDLTNRVVTASGQNTYGQAGIGNAGPTAGLTQVYLDKTITEVAAGDYTSFAVKSDGSLWVWGSNQYGARGDGTSGDDMTSPVQVAIPARITTPSRSGKHAVAVGTSSYAAIDSNGQVWTWGVNWNGRLGDGTTNSRYTPARVRKSANADDYLTDIVSISAGGGTMAALDADGAVWTWGAGANGSLGNGSTQDSPYAVQVLTTGPGNVGTPLLGITQVACGSSGFCIALIRYGGVFGWGSNEFSQLGSAPGGNASIATYIPVASSGAPVDVVAVGAAHCIAHATDGKVYGWGYNGRGQLGTGSVTVAQFPPTAMDSGPDGMGGITDLVAGANFSVMVRNSDRALFVTGDNQSGQLGVPGNAMSKQVPVRSSF